MNSTFDPELEIGNQSTIKFECNMYFSQLEMFPWEYVVNSCFFILKITNIGNIARYTDVDFSVM